MIGSVCVVHGGQIVRFHNFCFFLEPGYHALGCSSTCWALMAKYVVRLFTTIGRRALCCNKPVQWHSAWSKRSSFRPGSPRWSDQFFYKPPWQEIHCEGPPPLYITHMPLCVSGTQHRPNIFQSSLVFVTSVHWGKHMQTK